ncbi:NAD(P)H-dependent oxidoreductase [Frigidibacter sp. MR17.14]|uniref:FMN-dependent NADH-azoreductase n=1 Tax=Frigidibacter sp. MR17.14 TaxID=3126509 RepID=UPI003012D4ED
MTSVLFLSASPLGADARSHATALAAVRRLRGSDPNLRLIERDLTRLALGDISRAYADAIVGRAPPDHPAFALSETLIREIEAAQAIILATPMHNFTVPAALKVWIDLVLRAGRSFGIRDGRKVGLLADRPVTVVAASGSLLGPEARQPDHLTGYLTDVFATMGIRDLSFTYLDGLADPERAAARLARARDRIAQDARFGAARAI